MITIVIADDHQVVRQGLRALLAAEPDFTVLAETGDGLEAVQLAERLKPDVLIADLRMPGLSGLEIVRQVSQRARRTLTVVLSMYVEESYVVEALRSGAAGYLSKESSAAELVGAIRQVAAGHRYLGHPFSARTIDSYLKQTTETLDLYETLTNREREVLELLAQGLTNAEIAERLVISRRTVEAHRSSVMHKLGFQSQSDLVRYAIRRGILPLE